MIHNTFPFPEPHPLTRLNTRDDLKINAERWNLAHDYHRQRQNIVHQSLWEPGIVYGLGVKVIAPPETASSKFRDSRWIEIQPGIAIDIEGNPIVVNPEDDCTLRIAIPVPSKGSITVKVVIRYVDPRKLEISHTHDRVVEKFRLDQIKRELEPSEVELCRLEIARESTKSQDLQLKNPLNPLNPGHNELDLRYRQFAQIRSLSTASLSIIKESNNITQQGLVNLANSFSALYPKLQCRTQLISINNDIVKNTDLAHIIYLSSQDLLGLAENNKKTLETLHQHLQVYKNKIIIEIHGKDGQNKDFREILSTLTDGAVAEPVEAKDRNTLMRKPFLFSRPPSILGSEIKIGRAGNVLLVAGYLSKAWYGENIQRHEIRESQEFGINLIHFCWQQVYMSTLLE